MNSVKFGHYLRYNSLYLPKREKHTQYVALGCLSISFVIVESK